MADPTIKQLTVTGMAAESFLNKGGSRRKRRSSANKTQRQEGGSEERTESTVPRIVQTNKAIVVAPTAPVVPTASVTSTASVVLAKPVAVVPVPENKDQVGGKKTVKVILEAGKRKSTKVILGATKIKKLPAVPLGKTRKVAKKIRMSLQGLGKRVTRANTIRKDAVKEPIETIKKTLVAAKLIKPDSKAPDDILRKMYSDYMMLKNRAL